MRLFGIPAEIADQSELVKKYCFDICGKLTIAGLDAGDGIGCLYVCKQEPDDCICFDKQGTEPIGEVEGIPVFLRRLKDIK